MCRQHARIGRLKRITEKLVYNNSNTVKQYSYYETELYPYRPMYQSVVPQIRRQAQKNQTTGLKYHQLIKTHVFHMDKSVTNVLALPLVDRPSLTARSRMTF